MLYHQIKIRNNVIIFAPSSIPNHLLSFVNTDHLIKDKELTIFKSIVKSNG
jgi:hypothetical protein